ncbi:MAG: YhdP family protein [Methylophilaceae bacterium]
MVKKSLIWLYAATTYLLWAVIIVVTVVVLGLRYYVLPHAKDYREPIAHKVSQLIGQKVVVGDIDAGWNGLNPQFDLHKIDIYDHAGRLALQFDHVEAELSWLSLVVGEARLSNLVIHEPLLTVRREADGTIYVAGISMNAAAKPDFPNWLLRQQQIAVRDAAVVWQDDMRQAPPLSLEKLNLVIESPFSRSLLDYHRFGLTAVPSVGDSHPIDLRGKVYGGDVSQVEHWHGMVYVASEGTEISAWRTWLDLPQAFQQGAGVFRAWLEFSDNAIQHVTADVALANVVALPHTEKLPLHLQQLSGRLDWQRNKQGFALAATKLSLDADQGLTLRNGSARFEQKAASTSGELKVDALPLLPIVVLADYFDLSEAAKQKLAALALEGHLSKLNASWETGQGKLEKYAIRSDFSDVGMQPVDDIPGLSGLAGTLQADEKQGQVSLNTHSTSLQMLKLFRQPLAIDSASVKLSWKRHGEGMDIKVADFALATPHFKSMVDVSYRDDGIKGGYLDVSGDLRNFDLKYITLYYPRLLNKDTLYWLDTSILAGRADDVKIKLKGHVDDFPYIGGKTGEFSVTANLSDTLIDYANVWPKLEGMKLKMKFFENKMLLSEMQGRLLGLQLSNATARINALEVDHPVLSVEGQLQGNVEDGLQFVAQSPILEATHRFTEGMKGAGQGRAAVKLSIPLDNVDVTKVSGSYVIANGTLDGDGEWPTLQRINGVLNFTESSIKAKAVQAQVWGGPVAFNMTSGQGGRVDLLARGRLSHMGLRQVINHPLANHLSGTAEWQGKIALYNKRSDFSIDFPDMVGMASSLPAPFDKPVEAKAPLHLERKTGAEGDTIAVSYGDKLFSMKLARSQQDVAMRVERTDIRFGGEPHPAALARGLVVGGTLPSFDVDQWQDVLESKPSGAMPAMTSAKLKVGVVDAFGRRWNEVQLDAKTEGDAWKANIKSREINGDVTWLPQGNGHVIAKLDSLIIPETIPTKPDAVVEVSNPRDYPSITLTANQFETKGKKLGKLELRAVHEASNWNLEALRIENPDFVADMSGVWSNWRRNSNTRLRLDMDVTDLGKTLERFGYLGTVKGSTATLKGNLAWPDSPQAFTSAALSGDFSLNVDKGQFLKLQPGVGRLLGIVSLQNLPRRLTLDFRDVFSSGFAFDNISGDVKIAQGVMRSDNFVMEGAAAKVNISGETDLAKETQNLHVKVQPSISDSLSLAALAGGPAVAAGAYIAQKLFKDPLSKLISYEYDIVGTWDEPREVKDAPDKKTAPPSNPLGR